MSKIIFVPIRDYFQSRKRIWLKLIFPFSVGIISLIAALLFDFGNADDVNTIFLPAISAFLSSIFKNSLLICKFFIFIYDICCKYFHLVYQPTNQYSSHIDFIFRCNHNNIGIGRQQKHRTIKRYSVNNL